MSAEPRKPSEPILLKDYAPFSDARGTFQKIHRSDALARLGFKEPFRESFISFSSPGVIRGMHFQLPPFDQWKLVCCVKGQVLDVCVDLRAGPGYGKYATFPLSETTGHSLLIPPGFAHGFLSEGEIDSGQLYLTTREYEPKFDSGIRYDSFGFAWPAKDPVLSDRDRQLPTLGQFRTPWPAR